MAKRVFKRAAFLAEFLSRFLPIIKSEEEVLEEQRRLYSSDPHTRHSSADARS